MSETNGFDESKKGLSIASMVLGIIAFITSCLPTALILGLLAIIFGGVALYKKNGSKGMAIAGLVLGIISIIGWLVLILGLGAILGLTTMGLSGFY